MIRVFHIRTHVKTSGRIWNTNKPRYYWEDKAGGYGIQDPFGMMFVKRIEGDYWNVVGLPVSRLYQMFKDLGLSLEDFK